jgi:pyruvate/2-oxoglutarate dehydrogenase complex dihydrolipoamide acyltransferase (E2) component
LKPDKATIEVPSSVEGVVKEIKVKAGDKVKVGAVILTVDETSASPSTGNGASGSKAETAAAAAEPAKAPSQEQKVVSMPRRESPQAAAAQQPASEQACLAEASFTGTIGDGVCRAEALCAAPSGGRACCARLSIRSSPRA